MAPKVFITGVTGYVGGDALYTFTQAHPDWQYSVLVRDGEKAKDVAAAYPKAKLVYGTLDDAKIIEDAAAESDIVLHTADSSDHQGAANAISRGLKSSHTASRPGYWLHLGGAGILCWSDMENKRYGKEPLPEQEYDDLDGVQRLVTLPDTAFHRDVDKIVLDAAKKDQESVKVAIVCPPTIYGPGRGPANQRSRQIPGLVESTLKLGYGPKIGSGKTEWDNVHVHDLSDLFLLLAERAAAGSQEAEGNALWGPEAYYLAENGTHVWGDVAEWSAAAAKDQNAIAENITKNLPAEEAEKLLGFQGLSWGLNSKGKARRARKLLGWNPSRPDLKSTIPELVEKEAKSLGISK